MFSLSKLCAFGNQKYSIRKVCKQILNKLQCLIKLLRTAIWYNKTLALVILNNLNAFFLYLKLIILRNIGCKIFVKCLIILRNIGFVKCL